MDTLIVASSQFYSHYPRQIPKGSVNAEQVEIRLDKSWDGLTVFWHWKNLGTGVEKRDLLKDPAAPNTIPWEVLTDLGELRMGLVGMDGDTVIKPTIWLTYGYVVEGVDPDAGSDPQPPTPSWEQQMVEQARVAAKAAEEAKDAAVNAEKAASQAGPYADEAQKSAEVAKEAQRAASTSAQEAERAKQEAQNAAAAFPAPSPEFAGMVPVVNPEGTGYVFGDVSSGVAGEWELVADVTIEEEITKLQIDKNQDGIPFRYTEMYFIFTQITNDNPGEFWVNNSKMMITPIKNISNNLYGFLKVYNDKTLISTRGTNFSLSYRYGAYMHYALQDESEITQFLLTNIRAQAGSTLQVYGR